MSQTRIAVLPSGSATKVSRDEINQLPIGRYQGAVRVVSGHADLEHAMQDILQETVVGFDTETRPAFKPGESYLPSLVQLATASAVYLMQIQQHDLFGALREVLSSESVVKVGVSVIDDVRGLKKLFDFDERSMVDLGKVAKHHGLKQSGVRNLTGMFLGMRLPKGAKTTNWAARQLTPEQISYAATDAWACRELYLRFKQLKMV